MSLVNLFQHGSAISSVFPIHLLGISSQAIEPFNCQRTFNCSLGICSGFPVEIPVDIWHSGSVAANDRHSCVVLEKGLVEVQDVLCQVTAHVYSKRNT